ncbi:hypothetical protein [Streptomyces sp.]|uniref:telomere-protecting terminal protein Tpg n=1 Tax=Streptomyces sp. TaxID=1931 RepID=UPI00281259E6|nr:hypothetical protein [Streptomyces sp.]
MRDAKEIGRRADESGQDALVLSLLQRLDRAGLVSITTGDDGWSRLTVPESPYERRDQVSRWDPSSGGRRAQLPGQPHEIHRLGLAGNGSWIALGDPDEIRVLELPGCQKRFTSRQRTVTTDGIVIGTRARLGYTAPIGSTNQNRIRHLTVALPPQHAARLFDAQEAGASDQQLQRIAAEALKEVYFQDNGRRAGQLEEVRFTDIEHLEFEL